jgi:predicted RNase H-like nuclease (RuvC/YqgF family)
MERSINPVADGQRRALSFMLDAVGLPPAPDEGALAIRIVELEHTVTALLAENRRLRREVLELQHELDPEAVALEAFDREVDNRIDDARERRAARPRPVHLQERRSP